MNVFRLFGKWSFSSGLANLVLCFGTGKTDSEGAANCTENMLTKIM
jgi:hypothetical protein